MLLNDQHLLHSLDRNLLAFNRVFRMEQENNRISNNPYVYNGSRTAPPNVNLVVRNSRKQSRRRLNRRRRSARNTRIRK